MLKDMQNDDLTGIGTSENKTEEKFTKADRGEMVEYIEKEVEKFDFDGFEVVRREWFSKALCPAVTFKYGSVTFNVRAIRKLDECSHIQILMNSEKKLMIAKPCKEDDKDSLQCSKINKQGKTAPRTIRGKVFTAQLYQEMKWNIESTVKVLGTLLTCQNEKIFMFNLINAEAYLRLAEPCEDDPKRRMRVPFMPEHWQGHYGQSYEDSKAPMLTTFEGMEGFVEIKIPQLPPKKSANDKVNDIITADEATEQDNSNEKVKEAPKDGTV
jgi:hypothetical protein